MKIYNRQEFMELPEGFIFKKGKPLVFEEFCIKGDTITDSEGKNIDWFYYSFDIENNGSDQWTNRMFEMIEKGTAYPFQAFQARDGCFDEEDLFLVFDAKDEEKLINWIKFKV